MDLNRTPIEKSKILQKKGIYLNNIFLDIKLSITKGNPKSTKTNADVMYKKQLIKIFIIFMAEHMEDH